MYDIYGTEWCSACTEVKKQLTSRRLPYTFTTLPAGPKGWEIAEQLSGRRALPVVMKNGVVLEFRDFKAEVNQHTAYELTQEQLDRIEP